MDRIITPLASLTVLLMLLTLAVGLWLGTGDIRDPADTAARSWFRLHFLLGVATGLAVVLVNSIAVIYFIGTGRWCKEVVQTYSLDPNIVARSAHLKRQAFPYALVNMLLIVGVLALGGVADPGGSVRVASPGGLSWGQWHFLAAAASLAIIAYAYFALWHLIREHQVIIREVLGHVERIRRERGLPV
ncbi:MAG TPA: hypothetical protein VJ783_23465 [Pirellulales bacterium]|nr:hypothetical protein [Pirellulales bacterium]